MGTSKSQAKLTHRHWTQTFEITRRLASHTFPEADIDGWIVIGEFEGNVFQTRASRQVLLDLANNQPETLQTMVAAYRKQKNPRTTR